MAKQQKREEGVKDDEDAKEEIGDEDAKEEIVNEIGDEEEEIVDDGDY